MGTVFFFAEAATVNSHWKTSLHVGGLVTLVAGVHYMYMREYWVQVHKSPIVYRYVDWSITVPLQMIEFNLILKAAGKPVSGGMFWRLLVGTVIMLFFGYLGETFLLPAWPAFILGVLGWFFILYEIFAGEAGGPSTLSATFSATCSEAWMRPSSTCCTTSRILSTRLLSYLRAGPAPKQNLKARRMFCWLRLRW